MEMQKEIYKEEAYELLAELESSLLELEENADNKELIGRVFRAMHTIKGSGAMAGYHDIAEFTHELETVFDLVREGKMKITRELINLSLSARDQIKMMLDISDTDETEKSETRDSRLRIISSLRKLIPETVKVDSSLTLESTIQTEQKTSQFSETSEVSPKNSEFPITTYRIRFQPSRNVFKNGTNPILLIDELRSLGDSAVIPQTDAVPVLKKLDAETCYIYWDVILTTFHTINSIKDVFIFVEDNSMLKIDLIDDEGFMEDEADYKRLGEILVDRNDLTCDDLKKMLRSRKRIGEMLVEHNVVDQGKIESALAEQKKIRELRKKRQEATAATSIRVPADKLDKLVNLVGELVTAQARFSQLVAVDDEDAEIISVSEDIDHIFDFQEESELSSLAEEVERITRELREITMSIRMLPIGATFSKFKRMVRDLSSELRKKAILTTQGEDTELDKTVIDRLNDPLIHLIRNTMDHGIETPEKRAALGKPEEGTISLSAEHSGAEVVICISDDGAGIDTEVIRAKAVEKGLLSPDAKPGYYELLSLVFVSGFSTVKQVSDISGRGVGMDVVKQSIENLRGSVEIRSKKNVGTTVTLRLPLTLVIVDGLLVRVGEGFFVLPLSFVEECVELNRETAERTRNQNMMTFRGKAISYLSLRNFFMIEGDLPEVLQVVVVESNHNRTGIEVDAVIGKIQTVIKSLGNVYKDVKAISGATIMGDGTVALILDVNQLIQAAEKDGKTLMI